VSVIYAPADQYSVIMEVEPQYQRTPDSLSKLYIRSSTGPLVPPRPPVAEDAGARPVRFRSTISDSFRR